MNKNEYTDRDENWKMIAQRHGYRCAYCNHIPPYDERDIFFETKLCGRCSYSDDKRD